MLDVIAAIKKEVRLGKLRHAILYTDTRFNKLGKMNHIMQMGSTAAVIEYRVGEKRHWMIMHKYHRCPDNIYALAKAMEHRRKFKQSGVAMCQEQMKIGVD